MSTLLREVDNRSHADVHEYHEAALDALRARNRELELRHELTLIFIEHEDALANCFSTPERDDRPSGSFGYTCG
jgi:hypothetical protein